MQGRGACFCGVGIPLSIAVSKKPVEVLPSLG